MLLLIATLSSGFTACNDDDDVAPQNVKAEVMATFQQMFPNVNAHWEMERGKYKAEFFNNGNEVEAWFQIDGTWVRTKTDLRIDQLPVAIRERIAADYVGYYIDDADFIETPAETYYLIEIERQGGMEVYLKMNEAGEIMQ